MIHIFPTEKHRRGYWVHPFGNKCAYWFPCPGCGKELLYLRNDQSIKVNCETKGQIQVPNMLVFNGGEDACDNPLCKWSKLQSKYKDIGHVTIKRGERM